MTFGRISSAGLLAASLVVCASAGAYAQPRMGTGDAAAGRVVAERLCATCHALPGQAVSSTNPDMLGFATIAKRPNVSAEYLAGRIIIPHPAMPDTALKVSEIRDVIAYILSLK